jgi:hypothetical protein
MFYPFSYILLYVFIIIVSGFVSFKFFAPFTTSHALFAWLWFNVFIAIYEFYIVYQRKTLATMTCQTSFWNTPISQHENLWLRAWHEYTCYSDTRYMEPNNPVFLIEAMNAVIVVLLWIAFLFKSIICIYVLLVLQTLCCVLYFITLYTSRKTNTEHPRKALIYLSISSLWIIVPVALLFHLA